MCIISYHINIFEPEESAFTIRYWEWLVSWYSSTKIYLKRSWYLAKTSGNLVNNSLVLNNKSSKSIAPFCIVLHILINLPHIFPYWHVHRFHYFWILSKSITVIKLFLYAEILDWTFFGLYSKSESIFNSF